MIDGRKEVGAFQGKADPEKTLSRQYGYAH
jgi:hypothetical protein